jgi:hypothetical protein
MVSHLQTLSLVVCAIRDPTQSFWGLGWDIVETVILPTTLLSLQASVII